MFLQIFQRRKEQSSNLVRLSTIKIDLDLLCIIKLICLFQNREKVVFNIIRKI